MARTIRWQSDGVYGDLFASDPAVVDAFNRTAQARGLDTRMCRECGWQTMSLCRQRDGGAPGWWNGTCGPCRNTEYVSAVEHRNRRNLAAGGSSPVVSPDASVALQGGPVPRVLSVDGYGASMRLSDATPEAAGWADVTEETASDE